MFDIDFLGDVVLSQKLQEELNYEKDTGGAAADAPQFVKDLQEQGIWTVSIYLCFFFFYLYISLFVVSEASEFSLNPIFTYFPTPLLCATSLPVTDAIAYVI